MLAVSAPAKVIIPVPGAAASYPLAERRRSRRQVSWSDWRFPDRRCATKEMVARRDRRLRCRVPLVPCLPLL